MDQRTVSQIGSCCYCTPQMGIAKQRKELPFASFRERNIMPMKGRLFSMKEAFFLQKEGVFGKLTSNFRYV